MEIQKFKYLEKENYFLDEIKNISVVFEVFCSLQLQISACFMRLSPRRQWNRKLNLFISVWISWTLAIILLPFRLSNGHFRRFNSSLWLFCDKVHVTLLHIFSDAACKVLSSLLYFKNFFNQTTYSLLFPSAISAVSSIYLPFLIKYFTARFEACLKHL